MFNLISGTGELTGDSIFNSGTINAVAGGGSLTIDPQIFAFSRLGREWLSSHDPAFRELHQFQ